MKIFLDTSMFIGYFFDRDSNYQATKSKYQIYQTGKAVFLTSNYVIAELLTWVAYHATPMVLEKIIDSIEQIEDRGEMKVLQIDKTLDRKARQIMVKFADHKLSYTDASIYVLFKELKLDEVFTWDSDFKKIGLKTSF